MNVWIAFEALLLPVIVPASIFVAVSVVIERRLRSSK